MTNSIRTLIRRTDFRQVEAGDRTSSLGSSVDEICKQGGCRSDPRDRYLERAANDCSKGSCDFARPPFRALMFTLG
jgi:hypothetical protein